MTVLSLVMIGLGAFCVAVGPKYEHGWILTTIGIFGICVHVVSLIRRH